MQIKMTKPKLPNIADIEGQFSECLENGQVTNNGKYVQAFESELQKFFNSKLKPVCFCNGEMALYNLIRAHKIKANIPDGADVLVPSLTFVGTINAIVANNLNPVFCDVDETLTASWFISEPRKEKMIVMVGAYGNFPHIDIPLQISKRFNIPLILDTAPAFGSTYNGEYPDKFADCIYSFHATKTFTTMEGGCAITNDQQIYDLLIQLRDFGQVEKVRGNVIHPGLNSKMMEICAIIGLENLKTFKTNGWAAEWVAECYNKFFGEHEVKEGWFKTMKVADNVFCNYLYYPIILADYINIDEFTKHLSDNGIETRRYYTACHTLDAYKSDVLLPFTDSIKDRVVALPIHADMTYEEIQYLFDTIKNYFK